jgi:hypothetical protein
MTDHWKVTRLFATVALASAVLVSACSQPAEPRPDPLDSALESLRDATAAFQNLDAAIAAGHVAITPCWYHGNAGAMGYHYGRTDLIENGTVDLLSPEALMYEPRADGSFALVGVEYIVPIGLWQDTQPPSLLDQTFFRDEALGLFTLHIWHTRANPEGVFAKWNPDVSCSHAAEAEDRGTGSP